MSVDYVYDFTEGLYRVRVKTWYRQDGMVVDNYKYSDPPYKFTSVAPKPLDDISNFADYADVTINGTWSHTLSYENGINTVRTYGSPNVWERLSYLLNNVIAGEQYIISFEYRTQNNVTMGGDRVKRVLVTDIDPATVGHDDSRWVFGTPLGYVDLTNNTASETWVRYEIPFTAASNTWFVVTFDGEIDYSTFYEQFKDVQIKVSNNSRSLLTFSSNNKTTPITLISTITNNNEIVVKAKQQTITLEPYDFIAGTYRAFIRTAYKDGNGVIRNDCTSKPPYKFISLTP